MDLPVTLTATACLYKTSNIARHTVLCNPLNFRHATTDFHAHSWYFSRQLVLALGCYAQTHSWTVVHTDKLAKNSGDKTAADRNHMHTSHIHTVHLLPDRGNR